MARSLSIDFSEYALDEFTLRGLAVYDRMLKRLLEPVYDNQYVAIEPDTSDYAVAQFSATATRLLRERHPRKVFVVRKIGSEHDCGLVARMLAGRIRGDNVRGEIRGKAPGM